MRIAFAVIAAAIVGAPAAHAASCLGMAEMLKNFENVYPTGGPVERVAGARGRQVMERLLVSSPGEEVAFLYSGDGPTTGARGRYLYLVLDKDGCVLAHNWIDGPVFDRVLAE